MTRQRITFFAKLFVGVLVLAVIASQLSFRDTVRLRNGEIAKGTIVGRTETAVSFRGADGVTRLIKNDEIRTKETRAGAKPDISEGLVTISRRISGMNFALAMSLIMIMYLIGVERWRMLLRAQGLEVPFGPALRLTFIGFFFNNAVPGLTGGDVIKMVFVAQRSPGKRAEAVSTVIVDRVVGLVVLAMISAVVVLTNLRLYGDVAKAIFGFLLVCLVGLFVFFSRRVRSFLRVDRLVKKLPKSDVLRKLDQAFFLYRRKLGVVGRSALVSVVAHLLNIGSIYVLGRDIGIEASFAQYAAAVPVILIVSSIPLLPGGWGVGEAAYYFFFKKIGVDDFNLTVGLSILTRTAALFWSLLGGWFLVMDKRKAVILHGAVVPETGAQPLAVPVEGKDSR